MRFLLLITMLFASTQGYAAYQCNADCGAEASYRYPCPTFGNPGRKCRGRNPVKYATCEADKAASCRAVAFFTAKTKPMLKPHFNAQTYQASVENNETAKYMGLCSAAAASACAVIGAKYAAEWGAFLSGAGGVFLSYQICSQSTKW